MGDNKPPGPSPPSRASQDSHRRNTTTNTTNPVPPTESMADTHVRPQRSTALATSSCLQLASQAAVGDGGGSDCKSMLALACCDCGGCRARLCASTPSRDEMVVTCVVRSPEAQHAILDLRRKGEGSPHATPIRPPLRTDKLDALHHSSSSNTFMLPTLTSCLRRCDRKRSRRTRARIRGRPGTRQQQEAAAARWPQPTRQQR